MKKILILILGFFVFNSGFANELKISGIYHGKNLFVQNSLLNDTEGTFCITNVTVNGENIPDEIRSSAFVISLDRMDIELGQKIEIIFAHENNCSPLIINPEVLEPLSTYELIGHRMEDGYLVFETSKEASRIPFYVEQFRWGKWVQIDELDGMGGPENNDYRVKIFPHNGTNIFRLKQIDHLERISYSDTISLYLEIDEIRLLTKKRAKDKIEFSAETLYELYNEFGERIRFGGGTWIDIAELENGVYYLSWDDKVAEIEIRN